MAKGIKEISKQVLYKGAFKKILEDSHVRISDISPSDWVEQNVIMTSDVSPIPGRFSYDNSPYTREMIDCLSPEHPARKIAIQKGAQIGITVGLINGGLAWIISQRPGPIFYLIGHDELILEAIMKLDRLIDTSGIRHLITSSTLRARNNRTGDTNRKKEFPGGMLITGTANNEKLLRNRSMQYGFVDDFEAAKQSTKKAGATTFMIEQRFAAYYQKMKLFYISSPELTETSNIEPEYLKGDQRRYYIPCPCCGEMIYLEWNIKIDDKSSAGITWVVDEKGKLITSSVGYVCQSCGGFFNDSNKMELLRAGEWRATAEPSEEGYYSYHISSLYGPTYMYDWVYYVRQWMEANPVGQPQNETKQQAFDNLVLGLTFKKKGEAPKANAIQKNQRAYEIGTIPEKMSIDDGNGRIVLVTCAADLNGTVYNESKGSLDDARLDYEVVAWSESGATYSIEHGSIGTFIPREGQKRFKTDRLRWTYGSGENSVWTSFNELLGKTFINDNTGKNIPILVTGLDTGHFTQLAYAFIDNSPHAVVPLKGDKIHKTFILDQNVATFKKGLERGDLYLVQVNLLKDILARQMKLRWDSGNDEKQPDGFLNFPNSADGLYMFKNFFEHYESEHKVIEKKEGVNDKAIWEKKTSTAQNHFWDVRIYNMAVRDIWVSVIMKDCGGKNWTWKDYVSKALGE